MFAKSLATKVGWRLISTHSLWTELIIHNYIAPTPLLDRIKDLANINVPNGSIIWKDLCNVIPLILEGLVWKVEVVQVLVLEQTPGQEANKFTSSQTN